MESELQGLIKKDIKLANTALVCSMVVKKMELSAAADSITRKERNTMKACFVEMDDKEDSATAAVTVLVQESVALTFMPEAAGELLVPEAALHSNNRDGDEAEM